MVISPSAVWAIQIGKTAVPKTWNIPPSSMT